MYEVLHRCLHFNLHMHVYMPCNRLLSHPRCRLQIYCDSDKGNAFTIVLRLSMIIINFFSFFGIDGFLFWQEKKQQQSLHDMVWIRL